MTSARPTRPSIGDTTLVNSSSSSAARSAAATASTWARRLGRGAGAALALLVGHRVLARQPLRAPHLGGGRGRAPPSPARARRAGGRPAPGTGGRRSGTAAAPAAPGSLPRTTPARRGPRRGGGRRPIARASRRPVNSSHSVTSRASDGAAVTSGSGGSRLLDATWAQAARPRAATPARQSAAGALRSRVGRGARSEVQRLVCSWPLQDAPSRAAPTIRQKREAGVIRIRQGRIVRPAQAALIQRDEDGNGPDDRVPEARRRPIIDPCHLLHRRACACGVTPLADTPETDVARLQAELSFLRDERQRADAWRPSSATPCSSRSTCSSPIRTCAASSACSSSGWWTTPAPTPAASGSSTSRPSACDLLDGEHRRRDAHGREPGLGRARSAAREHGAGTWPPATSAAPRSSSIAATTRACRSRCAPSTARPACDVLLVAPLNLPPKTLGWIALSSVADSDCERQWLTALLDATARQATLALYYSRLVEQSLLRGPAAGGARRAQPDRARHPRHAGAGLRRHPDAAAGGAARRREPAAEGGAEPRHRRRPRAHAPRRSPPLGGGAAPALRRARGRPRGAPAHGRSGAAHQRRARRPRPRRAAGVRLRASSARSSASRRRR